MINFSTSSIIIYIPSNSRTIVSLINQIISGIFTKQITFKFDGFIVSAPARGDIGAAAPHRLTGGEFKEFKFTISQ